MTRIEAPQVKIAADPSQAVGLTHKNEGILVVPKMGLKEDEKKYLEDWPMTDEQKEALLARDYNQMLDLGGNIYFLAKVFFADGQSVPGQFRRRTVRRLRHEDRTGQPAAESRRRVRSSS